MPSFKIALLQLNVSLNKYENLSKVKQMALDAAKNGANIVSLPECFNGTYGAKYFGQFAEHMNPDSLSETPLVLSQLAKEANIYIIGGSIPLIDQSSGKLTNTTIVFDNHGKIIASYSKTHLAVTDIPNSIPLKESDTFNAGNQITSFETHGVVLMVYSAAFDIPSGEPFWETLLRARALDNLIYVAGCNPAYDENAAFVTWGHSAVVGPNGQVVKMAGLEEQILYADIANLARKNLALARLNSPKKTLPPIFPFYKSTNPIFNFVHRYSTLEDSTREQKPVKHQQVVFFISDLFPMKVSKYDIFSKVYSKYKASKTKMDLSEAFDTLSDNFTLTSIEDRVRDGGLRIYLNAEQPADKSLTEDEIKDAFKQHISPLSESDHSLYNLLLHKSYLVKDEVYNIFREYGKIDRIFKPKDMPGDNFVLVQYAAARSASRAYNCLYRFSSKETFIILKYYQLIAKGVVKEWASKHSTFVIPIIAAALATLLYSMFEPIREWSIKNKVTRRFDILVDNLLDQLNLIMNKIPFFKSKYSQTVSKDIPNSNKNDINWDKNNKQKDMLVQFLNQNPDFLILVSGSEEISKSNVVSEALLQKNNFIEIEADKLAHASGFDEQVKLLASMVGYRPYFRFTYQLVLLLDKLLKTVTDQPSGFYNSPSSRFTDVLNSVVSALEQLNKQQIRKLEKADKKTLLVNSSDDDDNYVNISVDQVSKNKDTIDTSPHLVGSVPYEDIPVIVISNFMNQPMEFSSNLIQWAAKLVSSGLAHVIFTSNNKSIHRDLQQAIPLKPLGIITLGDNSIKDSLKYVFNQLRASGELDNECKFEDFSEIHSKFVSGIGSVKKDLDYYIHEIIVGKSGKDAFDNVVSRAFREITKLSVEGVSNGTKKNNTWTEAQLFYLIKALSENKPISYTKVRMSKLFKGNDSILQNMQEHNIISIEYENGIPSYILPGRPVYSLAFSKLMNSPNFLLPLKYFYHKQLLDLDAATISDCEIELKELGFFNLIQSTDNNQNSAYVIYKTLTYIAYIAVLPVIYLGKALNITGNQEECINSDAVRALPEHLKGRVEFLLKKMKSSQKETEYHTQEMNSILKTIEGF
ncbi:hypothetical protein BB560_000323 [Smittium megazygosporum]|uniref:Mitochondrial escape protein 2 n=1 Tax=Smittium megazygosporum TaxID=133381 RepID=A0A2T9ZKN6_9FUNG|nr:hypothetical protein BB560_000323 [Smittium megazygosporum]